MATRTARSRASSLRKISLAFSFRAREDNPGSGVMADLLGPRLLNLGTLRPGKYTRDPADSPEESKRAAGNQRRLTERHLQIARELDSVADELGVTSAQAAIAWVRQRDEFMIPVVGIRKLDQLGDALSSFDVTLSSEQLAVLDKASEMDFGFPHELLRAPVEGQMVYGDLEPQIELPRTTSYRAARRNGT
jgi:hypothetical protein